MVPSGAYLAADALHVSGILAVVADAINDEILRVIETELDERELISSTSVDRG